MEIKKVFVVMSTVQHEDKSVQGVYLTQKKADKQISKLEKFTKAKMEKGYYSGDVKFWVDEIEVNQLAEILKEAKEDEEYDGK